MVTLKLSFGALIISTSTFLSKAVSSSIASKGSTLNHLLLSILWPGTLVVISRDCTPGFDNTMFFSLKLEECLKSLNTDVVSIMAQNHPNTHIAPNPRRSIFLPVLILASFLMIQVITPIIGATIKKISVPHAYTVCHPSFMI
eukprot:Mycagemm_TRINITY_DN10295_c2_g3::TRINITY_DN10295_c2_g3_i3::g.4107::m.4107 type:complete len:143 gc:universal TRINITY_DN10295_c2_g3_i3:2080-1652(-)